MVKEVKKAEMRLVEVVDHKEIKCDCCGKLIYPVIDEEQINIKEDNENIIISFKDGKLHTKLPYKNVRVKYYHVHTGHNDWGNDSIDSDNYLDLCSLECLHKQLDKFYKEDEPDSTTAYFEIEAELTPFN